MTEINDENITEMPATADSADSVQALLTQYRSLMNQNMNLSARSLFDGMVAFKPGEQIAEGDYRDALMQYGAAKAYENAAILLSDYLQKQEVEV